MDRLHIFLLLLSCFCCFSYYLYITKTSRGTINVLGATNKVDLGEMNMFYHYRKRFNKTYGRDEFQMRYRNVLRSMDEISMLNKKGDSAVYGLTKFSDLSPEEVEALFHNNKSVPSATSTEYMNCVDEIPSLKPILDTKMCQRNFDERPAHFDWRQVGYVAPVLEQKLCNACFAFSIAGVMESAAARNKIYHGRASIQELIDCSYHYNYSHGCQAGNILKVLRFLCLNKFRDRGLTSEDQYPLTLVEETCQYKPPVVKLKEYLICSNLNERNLPGLIWKYGPAIVVVNSYPWLNYIEGVIYRACSDPGSFMSHVVQIVGYDTRGPNPHYIIRNSWGKDFGEHGYVKLQIGENICGVADSVGFLDVYNHYNITL